MHKTSLAKKVFISLFLLVLFSKPTAAAEKPEIFVQLGHSDRAPSIAFSPDGRYALSGGYDRTVRLWDVSTGKEIRTFLGHLNSVTSVTFSPDGRYALSGDWDEIVKLWEISTGKEIRTFNGGSYGNSVSFSSDGKHILYGSISTIKRWEVSTGRELQMPEIRLGGYNISPVKFSTDGRYALAGYNKDIKLLDLSTGEVVWTLQGHTDFVDSVALSRDGRYALSGSRDKTVKLWDVSTGKEVWTLRYPETPPSVAFSPDGKYALSGSRSGDGTLNSHFKLCEVVTGKEVKTFQIPDSVLSVVFSPDGRYVLSSGYKIALLEVSTGKELRRFQGNSAQFNALAFSSNGQQALSHTINNTFKLWDISTGRVVRTFQGHTDSVYSVALSRDGRYALSGSRDKTLKLWDVVTGMEIRTFSGHSDFVSSVAFSPDGRYALSGSRDSTCKLWEISTGKEIWTFQTYLDSISYREMIFSPDGRYILILLVSDYVTKEHTMKLLEVSTGREIRSFDGLGNTTSVAFSPDGQYALTGGGDVIALWEVAAGKQLRTFDLNKDKFKKYSNVTSVAFSPDGRYALSGGYDNTVRLWDISTGREVRRFLNPSRVLFVAFSPDGRYALSGSINGVMRIWNIATGNEICTMAEFKDGEWIVITPEGYYNSSANGDKHLNVRIGNNVYGIENYREAFYRPDLVKLALSGGSLKDFKTLADVKQPPVVTIVDTPKISNKDEVKVTLKIVDIGGGIGDVRLYLNGSAVVLDSARGVKIVPTNKNEVLKTYNLKLTNGLNTIRAIAFNAENTMQSNDVLHEITASFKSLTKPSLNAIIVGINEYKNPKLQLKYAVSDAELFEDTLKKVTAGLFEKVNIKKLVTKENTTSENIIKELKSYKALNPDDVFVFFVASHGTVDDGEYFLITSNVGSTRTEKLKTDALPQGMLKELIANIPATKKLIIIDTCSAGALGEAIQVAMLTRGMSEDTAMKILSRAVGSTILSASTSLQEAVEGYKGHGLFTYVLVEGLKGKADKGKTGYVKTTELADYVDSEVPVLAEKVFKKAQYPTISISGQAFPIGKTGK